MSISTQNSVNEKNGSLVGCIYMKKEIYDGVYREGDEQPVSLAKKLLNMEVELYNNYLKKECYYFTIQKNGENVLSVKGFSGQLDDEMLHEMVLTAEDFMMDEDVDLFDIECMFAEFEFHDIAEGQDEIGDEEEM